MDEAAFLRIPLGGGRHRDVAIEADPFLIGRRRDNHVVLPDTDISRVQAIIRREGDAYVIEDQKSLYGMGVNGETVDRCALRNRDVIAFGRERTIEVVFLHGDRMSRILDEIDRAPEKEISREEIRNLHLLLEISKGLNVFTSLTDLLELTLDAAVDLTRAERGFVMLKDGEGEVRMQASRNMAGERILPENLRISMSIVKEVLADGRPIFLADALERSDLRDRSSIAELKLRSIACLPIRIPAAHALLRPGRRGARAAERSARPGGNDEVLGVIYTDSSQATRPLSEVTRGLVESVATHAAISVENFLLRQEELEHRLLEKEMEKLRELDRLKSDFVSHVSHELRTPLTAIKGALDNMLDGLTGDLNDKQTRYLQRMRSNTEHLVRLVEDILDLSRIEAGQIALHLRSIPVARLLVEICDSLRPLAAARDLTLTCGAPEDLVLTADRDRLTQVLLNLAGNALKFTPPGGRVEVSATADGPATRIAVTDTGVGIDPAERARVFDRFYRGSGGAEKAEGTGLGLSIAKSLVELHGGSIAADGAPGGGSMFTVSLPSAGARRRPTPTPTADAGRPAPLRDGSARRGPEG